MANRNNSAFLDGGDDMGMTNEQYKGILLDQLEVWQETLELAIEAEDIKVQKKAEQQIAKIQKKLEF